MDLSTAISIHSEIGIILPIGVREKDYALKIRDKIKSKCLTEIVSFATGEEFTSPAEFDKPPVEKVVIFDNLSNTELISLDLLNEKCYRKIFLIPFDLTTDLSELKTDIYLYTPKPQKDKLKIRSMITADDITTETIESEIFYDDHRKVIITSEEIDVEGSVRIDRKTGMEEVEEIVKEFNDGEIDFLITPFLPAGIVAERILIFENYLANLNDAILLHTRKHKMKVKLIGTIDEMDYVQELYNERYDFWEKLIKGATRIK